jgi:hypothetical protein
MACGGRWCPRPARLPGLPSRRSPTASSTGLGHPLRYDPASKLQYYALTTAALHQPESGRPQHPGLRAASVPTIWLDTTGRNQRQFGVLPAGGAVWCPGQPTRCLVADRRAAPHRWPQLKCAEMESQL